MRTVAIIVAGGAGERFGRAGGKQLARFAGASVLGHTLDVFDAADVVDGVIVVVHPDRLREFADEVGARAKVIGIVPGGDTRQDSVAAGLASVPADADVIIVHDGARPLVTAPLIAEAVRLLATSELDGVVVGHPAYDTIKRVDLTGVVQMTEDRSGLWLAQTPQVFCADALRRAFEAAATDRYQGTDDATLVERVGGHVLMLAGPRDNIKVTVPEDLLLVERLLEAREEVR